MGCDFQIFGYQPDADIRRDCLEFVHHWMTLTWPKLSDEEDHSVERMYSFNTGMQVERIARGVFNPPQEAVDRYLSAESVSQYEPGLLSGLVLPWRPDPFLFDTKAGGELCNLAIVPNDSFENRRELFIRWSWPHRRDLLADGGRLKLGMGFLTRMRTGAADLYVFAAALRARFLLNCVVNADYDVETYDGILTEIQFSHRIADLAGEQLASTVVACAKEAQAIYDESVREYRRQKEERRIAAEKEFIERLGSWERQVFFATRYSWGQITRIPLLGLQDAGLIGNPIELRELEAWFEDINVGQERIRDIDLDSCVIDALESRGIMRVCDAWLMTIADFLAIDGMSAEILKEFQEFALAALGKASADVPEGAKNFQIGDDR